MSQPDAEHADLMYAALNRLAKWRTLLTGWQLGTRPKGDPECDAVRDQRELLLLLRCELTALTRCLLEADLIDGDSYAHVVAEEADLLSMAHEARFPGVRATDQGMVFDARAADTMRGWRP